MNEAGRRCHVTVSREGKLGGDCVFWLVMACFGVSWSTLVALDLGVYNGHGEAA